MQKMRQILLKRDSKSQATGEFQEPTGGIACFSMLFLDPFGPCRGGNGPHVLLKSWKTCMKTQHSGKCSLCNCSCFSNFVTPIGILDDYWTTRC